MKFPRCPRHKKPRNCRGDSHKCGNYYHHSDTSTPHQENIINQVVAHGIDLRCDYDYEDEDDDSSSGCCCEDIVETVASSLELSVTEVVHRIYCQQIERGDPNASILDEIVVFGSQFVIDSEDEDEEIDYMGDQHEWDDEDEGEEEENEDLVEYYKRQEERHVRFVHRCEEPSRRQDRLRAALDRSPQAIQECRINDGLFEQLSPADAALLLDSLAKQTKLAKLLLEPFCWKCCDGLYYKTLYCLRKTLLELEVRTDLLGSPTQTIIGREDCENNRLSVYQALSEFQALEVFSLLHIHEAGAWRVAVDLFDVSRLFQSLGKLSTLKSVSVKPGGAERAAWCEGTKALGFVSGLFFSSSLNFLDLSGMVLQDPACRELEQVLRGSETSPCGIQTLVLPPAKTLFRVLTELKTNTSVTVLKLGHGGRDMPLHTAGEILESNETIEYLEVKDIDKCKDLLPVFRSLGSNKTLKELDITNVGCFYEKFLADLNESLCQNKTLQAVRIEVKKNHSIYLYDTSFGTCFETNRSLETLHLSGVHGKPGKLVSTLRSHRCKLRSLSLCDSGLGDTHLEFISTLFSSDSKCCLESLDLSRGRYFTSDGIKTFLTSVLENKPNSIRHEAGYSSLKRLSFCGVEKAEAADVIEKAEEALTTNFVLEKLDLGKYKLCEPDRRAANKLFKKFIAMPSEDNAAKREDWVCALATASHDVDVIFYLILLHLDSALNALAGGGIKGLSTDRKS